MVDGAMLRERGGRDENGDCITKAGCEDQMCLILCDGLGGHACGEVASELVAASVAEHFEKRGYYPDFLKDAFEGAQQALLDEQERRDLNNSMKTTLVVLVITPELIQWAHIGDSRRTGSTTTVRSTRERVTTVSCRFCVIPGRSGNRRSASTKTGIS